MQVRFPGPSVVGIARTRKTDHSGVGLLVPGEVRLMEDAEAQGLVDCGLIERVEKVAPAKLSKEDGEERAPQRRRKEKE